MCGIAGFLTSDPGPRKFLKEALASLYHRGPDDVGTSFHRSNEIEIGLGSTRLAIVDLSPAGHMPMSTADGTCSLVFNGEIYDAAIHRRGLEGRGVIFKSRTDTEVLLYGLALDGPEFLDRIDGMYAFAFWDGRKPTTGLLLGRDRFGEKPLFLAEKGNSLFFASELPALMNLTGDRPSINLAALAHVVEWGYPPAEHAIFEGVRKLRPGTWEFHGSRRRTGELKPLSSDKTIRTCADLETAGAMVRNALRDSVRDRLVADVPVGVFLSGGLDSAGIAAIARDCMGKSDRLNTYTVGYPGSEFSEVAPAREISRFLGTQHHEITVDHESLKALPYVASALGEPVGDPASLPTFFLSVFARQTSTVLLTGEGADEVFFGYPRYLLHDMADGQPHGSPAHRVASRFVGSLLTRVRAAPSDCLKRDRQWKGLNESSTDLLLAEERHSSTTHQSVTDCSASVSRADDLARWLPSCVLTRVDRMTMAASIESRAPYLGRDVARLGYNLPPSLQRHFPFGKVVLRAALKPYLSRWKRWGVKRAFAVPLIPWLTGPLRSLFDDVFFGNRLLERGWFRPTPLRTLGVSVLRGDRASARLAWTILTLELWARAHIDGEQPEKPNLERVGPMPTYIARSRPRRKNLVLAIDFPPAIGGIQLYNQEMWGHGGFGDLSVIAPKIAGDVSHDRAFPAKITRLPSASGYAGRLMYLSAVALNLPRHLSPHTVLHISHTALAPALLPFSNALCAPMVVWTYALELTNPRLALLTRRLLHRADRVVVISEYTRRLAEARGAHADRIVKIRPGGDDLRMKYPSANGSRFKSQFGISAYESVILSVGRLSPLDRYKGFDRIIEVASELAKQSRNYRWIIVGNGPDLPMYRARVQAAGLNHWVVFCGGLPDASLADAYAACDLFCLLSREEFSARGTLAEGYGIVFVQAGSFGKPVVGLDRGGVSDAVLQGQTGLLLKSDDATLIAETIEWLMEQPAERERLGRNGLQNALGPASWAQSRARLGEMLDAL